MLWILPLRGLPVGGEEGQEGRGQETKIDAHSNAVDPNCILQGQTRSPRATKEDPWAGTQENTGAFGQRLSQEGETVQVCQQRGHT